VPWLNVAVNAKTIICLFAGQVDFLKRSSNVLTVSVVVDKNVYVDDRLIATGSEMVIPLTIGIGSISITIHYYELGRGL
jgi:hypothetical protein